MAPITFCPRRESRRQDHESVPVWMALDSRLPSGPKTLPRRPMAAGMKSNRPGLFRRVSENRAKVKPVTRLVVTDSAKAPRLCPASLAAGPRRPPKGRQAKRGTASRRPSLARSTSTERRSTKPRIRRSGRTGPTSQRQGEPGRARGRGNRVARRRPLRSDRLWLGGPAQSCDDWTGSGPLWSLGRSFTRSRYRMGSRGWWADQRPVPTG